MILTLLLQNALPQGPPYAIYATLAVGILSLIASGLNIYFSSKTAQRVVNLSTKTTREVAELSAQVSRESAGLAAETARELKVKEYRNDFNKKILERRLTAWADAEQFLLPLRATVVVSPYDNKDRFAFFSTQDSFNKTRATFDQYLISQLFWLGGDYAIELIKFRNKLGEINDYCMVKGKVNNDGSNVLDLVKLTEIGAVEHQFLNKSYSKMVTELATILSSLHDIDGFLDKKSRGI